VDALLAMLGRPTSAVEGRGGLVFYMGICGWFYVWVMGGSITWGCYILQIGNSPDKVLAVGAERGLLEEPGYEAVILDIEDVLLLEGSLAKAGLHLVLAHGLALRPLLLGIPVVIAALRHCSPIKCSFLPSSIF